MHGGFLSFRDPGKFWRGFLFAVVMGFFVPPVVGSVVSVHRETNGWELRVDGTPYFVKGVCYQPTRVGEDPAQGSQRDWMTVDDDHDGRIDTPYQTWVDVNRNNVQDPSDVSVGDFQLLRDMGCNTLRIYHHAPSSAIFPPLPHGENPSAQSGNLVSNKPLLRDLFATYGIRVAMGDLLGAYTVGSGAEWGKGTDYRDRMQRKRMLKSVEKMVLDHKDEPYLLMWVLGNENNFPEKTHTNAKSFPGVYARFVNEAAELIHRLDPHHPVCVVYGDVLDFLPFVPPEPAYDLVGINSYRTPDFGNLWADVAQVFDRPLLLTEMGAGPAPVEEGVLDETAQSVIHANAWQDIYSHSRDQRSPANALGGFVFEWTDNWWYNGSPHQQGVDSSPSPWNEEYMGLASQGDGKNSPWLRQLRPVYFMYQKLWRN
ncbi:MAG: hypothetical protein JNK54_03285 [Elusimicrobia bacterium]|nr:hypothetical protein [Elusimicrobiota bacterium]